MGGHGWQIIDGMLQPLWISEEDLDTVNPAYKSCICPAENATFKRGRLKNGVGLFQGKQLGHTQKVACDAAFDVDCSIPWSIFCFLD